MNNQDHASTADTAARSAQGTAFVAGATGYTGQALVAELRRRGVPVVAHVRPDSSSREDWRVRLEGLGARVSTAVWQEDAMAAELADIQPAAIFAMLGTTRARMRKHGKEGNSYEAVDYGLTALLLRAALRAAPDAHFVYLSAIGAGPRARGDYLRVRWRMEQELQASGMSHHIIRPAFITGDRAESRPAELITARIVDAALAVAGRLGARRLRERYRSRTAAELAQEIAIAAYGRGVDG